MALGYVSFENSLQQPIRNESVAVGLTAVIISDTRNSTTPRTDILVRNISPNATDIISVSLGQVAQNNVGIVLRQYESFTFSTDSGYICPQVSFSAICATATGVLAVMER
jgi:hypothetical protein